MKFTVDQIAQLIQGTVDGDGSANITAFNKIEDGQEGSISFLANPKYESFLYLSKATAIIVAFDLILKEKPLATLIKVKDPYSAFTILLQKYQEFTSIKEVGIQQPTFVASTAKTGLDLYLGPFSSIGSESCIGNNTYIAAHVTIGNKVSIGNNCVIYPGVVIYNDTIIGDNCTLHANAVIGSDGFGFAPQADGTFTTIPQLGNVVLEDGVSVGANTTIDRATMGSTLIKKGVKIDNLVQIAHNVEIGANTAIAAQTGVSGSTKIGQNCLIGGQVGVAGHITVADKTIVTAQSGVTKTVRKEGQILGGTPASPNSEYLKRNALLRQLPDLLKRLES
ncbi:MAG: UDP-3-O-(3-hydroxymyristoyl)glucosamine N-acyltransferase [Bacteroidota bacterium]